MTPLLLTHPACLEHVPGGDHPERPARLAAALRGAQAAGLTPDTSALPATRADLVRVHDAALVDALLAAAGRHHAVDPETLMSPGTVDAMLHAAGVALEATRRLLAGDARRVLALVRPPGHHAERDRALGFCFVNHVAVAAAEARRLGAARVAVVDVDAHFGNGTQHIFHADPTVLCVDLHEDALFPEGGDLDDRGRGPGHGFTINLPLLGAGDATYAALVDQLVAPAIRAFRPDILLISLGFDAHRADPLANLELSSAGYGHLLGRLAALADEVAGGRLLALLEGGYDLAALETATRAVARALAAPAPAAAPPAPAFTRRCADALAALAAGIAREAP
ncbi:MAG: histone deacetylase [Myxococcales bacterium]|nr:histone deacetylase [Myxococcales bacterium]